jgi:hypothetical protein
MRKYFFILVVLLIPVASFAQIDEYLEDDPEPTITNHRGLAYSLLETGSGLGLFYELPIESFFHLGVGFDAFMLRDRGQFTYTSPFTGRPVDFNKENNVFLFDLLFTAKKRLFVDKVDDSFRPFLTAAVGPVFGMNFPESDRDDEGFKLKNQYRWTVAGILGAGIDADVDGKYFFGIRAQYRIMPFFDKLGERTDHSMIDIRLEIGQRF